jgi:hypothetical protein
MNTAHTPEMHITPILEFGVFVAEECSVTSDINLFTGIKCSYAIIFIENILVFISSYGNIAIF